MVKRNLTVEFEFVCFTENPLGLDTNIRIEPLTLKTGVEGWWYKLLFFDKNLPLKGTILFLDLDVIIFENIDKLFQFKPKKFCIIRDFNRYVIKNYQKFNSSVFRLETGSKHFVYENFSKDYSKIIRQFRGDQEYIFSQIKDNFEYWPDDWIQSYKWEMRSRPPMTKAPKGERNFILPGKPAIKPDTSIAVFHGDPNPHNCIDPWCKQHWY